MTSRRYRLLCPIARALDRVGDRWTLILLRDLHAGPARFTDLQTLPGIASNLLTSRLRQLEDDGLIRRRDGEYGTTLYELTELGTQTADLLFELAAFGSRFPPDEPVKRPGNLRTIAVTLKAALQRVVEPKTDLRALLLVDREPFIVAVRNGRVDVRSGDLEDPDVTLETDYSSMVAVGDGRMDFDDFIANHAAFSGTNPAQVQIFARSMTNAVELLRGRSSARP